MGSDSDWPVMEAAAHALAEFEGTIIMTTHDINFDTDWVNKIIELA